MKGNFDIAAKLRKFFGPSTVLELSTCRYTYWSFRQNLKVNICKLREANVSIDWPLNIKNLFCFFFSPETNVMSATKYRKTKKHDRWHLQATKRCLLHKHSWRTYLLIYESVINAYEDKSRARVHSRVHYYNMRSVCGVVLQHLRYAALAAHINVGHGFLEESESVCHLISFRSHSYKIPIE